MSTYNQDLQTNNLDLQGILDTINELLPDKIPTCAVKFEPVDYNIIFSALQITSLNSETGQIETAIGHGTIDLGNNSATFELVCNSSISGILRISSEQYNAIEFTGITPRHAVFANSTDSPVTFFWWEITAAPGETATITFN